MDDWDTCGEALARELQDLPEGDFVHLAPPRAGPARRRRLWQRAEQLPYVQVIRIGQLRAECALPGADDATRRALAALGWRDPQDAPAWHLPGSGLHWRDWQPDDSRAAVEAAALLVATLRRTLAVATPDQLSVTRP